ncbi:MAG: alpha-E domain-containing protein [Bacteroidota bacterium]|nr:alpha-E domain-containing protein [Bacteroidota bacterium]
MLSRIGNSLFWMGRYIERTEHIARYTKVQYVSSVDVPLGQSRDLIMESILDMAGSRGNYTQVQEQLLEDEVINYITISDSNPYSLIGYIGMIRENARGARDRLSIELWEAINSFYHKTNHYTPEDLQNEGVEAFARKIEEHSYVIKGYIDNTLLRNEEWRLISLGIYLERAIQICQILQTKLKDIEKIDSVKLKGALENYHWTTILESTESFDMYMRCQRTPPNRHNVLHFLLFDMDFPKSVAFSLSNVKNCIQGISFQEEKRTSSLDFIAGKLACRFSYNTIEEVENSATEFLKNTLQSIYELTHLLDVKYLKYK